MMREKGENRRTVFHKIENLILNIYSKLQTVIHKEAGQNEALE